MPEAERQRSATTTPAPARDADAAELVARLRRGDVSARDAERAAALLESAQTLAHERDVQLRRQELDFTTVLEITNQINAKSLDATGLESYIAYVVSTTRGQFGVVKAHLLRQVDLESTELMLPAPRPGEPPLARLHADSAFGRRLRDLERPVLAAGQAGDGDAELWQMEEGKTLKRLGSETLIPLVRFDSAGGRELNGVLCLGRRVMPRPYAPSEVKFMGLLGQMIAISLRNAQLHRKSITDALTGVYSRGHFDMHLATEIARTERYGRNATGPAERPLTLIMLDVDHFKKVNDTHGHPAGDAVLIAVAHLVQRRVRKSDMVARYGGEEFVLIAPETPRKDGVLLAERLRKGLEDMHVDAPDGTRLRVTASFGVASYPLDASGARELVARADESLYRAKSGGRNRVEAAGAPDGSSTT